MAESMESGRSAGWMAAVVFSLLGGVGLIVGIVWACGVSDVVTGLGYVAADRWGVVTLVDLGVGLIFVGAWIAVLERNALRTVCWLVALGCLGNLTTLVYVLVRARRARTLSALLLGTGFQKQ